MYHWVEDKEFLTRSYSLCADIVNQLVQNLKNCDIDAAMNVVGSKKRNMITQNEDQDIDFDFNLLIKNPDECRNTRELKEVIRKAFNEVLKNNGLDDCEDSTSALTTKSICFNSGNQTGFHIDLCIVRYDSQGHLNRLIHEKSGCVILDYWIWNRVPNSLELRRRERFLKPKHWLEVRNTYLKKKNMYLKRPYDNDHPSFVCYIEAVNEVYEKVRI